MTNQFSLPEMKKALLEIDADIVCLQELYGEHRKHKERLPDWPEEESLAFLADGCWLHRAYGKNVESEHSNHGNGILSKMPITRVENIDITSGILSSRGLLHAVVNFEGLPLHIMCTHLGLFKSERMSQYSDLEQRIKEYVPDDEPLIIAGDFNDWLLEAEEHLCKTLQLKEVFTELQGNHAKSFPSFKPILSVDRIYYRNLKPIDCKILTETPWNRLSDHVPLWAAFSS